MDIKTVAKMVLIFIIVVVVFLAATGQLNKVGKAAVNFVGINLVSKGGDIDQIDLENFEILANNLNACATKAKNCFCDFELDAAYAEEIKIGFEKTDKDETKMLLYHSANVVKKKTIQGKVGFMRSAPDGFARENPGDVIGFDFELEDPSLIYFQDSAWSQFGALHNHILTFYVTDGEVLIQNDKVPAESVIGLTECSAS